MARIWDNGYATPCKKIAVKGKDYCITHIDTYQKLGRIDENRTGDGWKSSAMMKEVYLKDKDIYLPLDNHSKLMELNIALEDKPKKKKTIKFKLVPNKKNTSKNTAKCYNLIKDRYKRRNKNISKKIPICLARTWQSSSPQACGLPCHNTPKDGSNYCGNHSNGKPKLGNMNENRPDGYDWEEDSIYKEIDAPDGSGTKIPIYKDGTHIL